MALTGFNVLVQVEDAVGEGFVTYGVVAADKDQACKLAAGAAQAEGFWNVEIDEAWCPEGVDPADLGDVPEVLGRTEPTYLDEDELDEADELAADDDEE
ncbi:hypothetical protein [uncultured Maricaulis sp.]|uniref:hypothetical protein n=1 Tax=uncultured Maricaulis sp. TaxID=174710 RepID=UPI0030DCF03A|tara:strand:+ start:44553 stop:44849 length:297 start_codon:yes stop_codon:yes gene_type:complete